MSEALLEVEVVYAAKECVIARSFRVQAGSCIGDVLRRAAADPAFSGVVLEGAPVGVFGRLSDAKDLLHDGDRVEIYRPLEADPKVARRARAAASPRAK